MWNRGVFLLGLAATLATAASAEAQTNSVPGGGIQLTGKVSPGQTVYVMDTRQRETEGRLISLTGKTLTIEVRGEPRTFEPDDVFSIARRGDSLWNGAAIGAAVLGGVYLFATTAGNCKEGIGARYCAALVGAGTGVGAAIGALVDAAVKGKTVVYQAPASRGARVTPIFTPSGAGVQVALRF